MAAGDRANTQAIDGWYSQHHRWLSDWLRRRLGCTHTAADLAQDTFLRIIVSRDILGVREPRAYLATVAGGLVSNHFRRLAIERAYLAALATLPEPQVPSPETRAVVLETLIEIDRLLDGLPDKARRAFLLAQLEGLTHAEIAPILGVSVSMVKQYMLRAVRQCYFALTS